MTRFLVRRVLQAVGTVLLATLVVHASVTILPGDPVRALFGFRPPPPAVIQAIRDQYHLDDPYVVQYLLYLRDVVTLDFGSSLRFGGTVREIILDSWLPTTALVAASLVLQTIVGIGFGFSTTLRPSRWSSRWILAVSAALIAAPVVLTAPLSREYLTIRNQVFPYNSTTGGWTAWILPVIVLSAMTVGLVVLFTRSELRQTLRAPFIQFAVAAGVPPHRLMGVHAMRAAAPPIVSYLTSNLGFLVVGVLIVEGTMGIDGLGSALFGAIRAQDRSVVVSIVMVITVGVIVLNLLADLLVAALDPRARAGMLEGGG